ncbi:formin-like protein 16 [Phragmites australis]|uniref:formin-like protein 16 n=1 Tax=Phragmites australis TaxID=29695 RepID=UPI002D798E75|nr:formin-like protein 16 [Phragmites australis]
MASAAASRPPAPPPPPPAVQWLGPRVSFSFDEAGGGGGREAVAGGKPSAGADFEFLLAGCSAVSMLPADELFSGGKLVPLRIPASAEGVPVGVEATTLLPKQEPAPAQQQPETPRAEETAAKGVAASEEPKIPARRWRDLLRLRKQQVSSGSASTSEPRPLGRLLRRGPKPPESEPSLSLPLLRESGSDEPDKPEKTSPAPIPTPTPPPPSQHQNLPPKIRLSPSQATAPPPPAAVAADSPRLNAAGKVVFNGLGRSSSSPSSLAGGRRHRAGSGGAIERSYSAHVRVAPVLNVPVCSLRGSRKSVSVLGIDRFFSPASSATSAAGKKAKAAKKEVTAAK